jgi:hypothetical protein
MSAVASGWKPIGGLKPIDHRYARLLERLEEALDAIKCGNIAGGKHEIERVLRELRNWEFVSQARPL